MRRATALLTAAAAAAVLTGCAPSSPDAIEAAGLTEETANDPVVPTGPGGEVSSTAGDIIFRVMEGVALDGA